MSSKRSFVSPSFSKKKAELDASNLISVEPIIVPPPAPVGRRRGLIEPVIATEDLGMGISLDTLGLKGSVKERPRVSRSSELDLSHILQTGTMDRIRFSFFSSEEVANFSVVELREPKLEGPNSVYDLRMGPSEDFEVCETCNESRDLCPGHFGHIALNVAIPHPLCSRSILNFLNCFCYKCHRLVLTKDEIFLKKLNMLKATRFEAIQEEIRKNVQNCHHSDCNYVIPEYSFEDDKYYKAFKNKKKVVLEYNEIVDIFSDIREEDIALLGLKDERYTMYVDDKDNPLEDSLVHPTRLILENLPVLPPCARPYQINNGEKSHDDLTDLYKQIISINNELAKPEKLNEYKKQNLVAALVAKIRTLFDNSKKKTPKVSGKLPLLGIKERISGKQGHIRKYLLGKRTDFSARTVIGGDNTIGVNEVIVPVQVAQNMSVPMEVTTRNIQKCQDLLDSGKVLTVRFKGRTHKRGTLADKLLNTMPTDYHADDIVILPDAEGKEVRVDLYTLLMGKHPEWFDAGGVIIARDKVANEISKYQVIRNEYVKVPSEEPKSPDAIFFSSIISEKKSTADSYVLQEQLIPPRAKKTHSLHIGDIIDRQVQNGDWVVFNRQPTLWKGSMQAKQVKILPGKTFRMSLATTQAFNADHDGDEMNVSFSERPDTTAEIKELMSTNETFISSKDSSPMLTVKLDVMTGWYKLTRGFVPIRKDIFMDCLSRLPLDDVIHRIDHVRRIYRTSPLFTTHQALLRLQLGLDPSEDQVLDRILYSGYGLFSFLCPIDFEFVCVDSNSIKMSPDQQPVTLLQGVMISGTFSKESLGSQSGSLLHHLAKDYGNAVASDFIMNLQCFANDIFQHMGFSCGMEDFVPRNRHEIQRVINESFVKAYAEMVNEKVQVLQDTKVDLYLNQPKQEGQKYSATSLSQDNNLVVMVRSGAKGKWPNISEITSVVGQQFVGNKRIPKVFGGRSLSCFPRSSYRSDVPDQLPPDHSLIDAIRIFESRGFITSSYFDGLKPTEYFLVALGGRQGLIDTAVSTAETGYIQRKIAKILEDLQVSYVGTVNTPSHNIVQFAYGGDNMDAARLIKCSLTDNGRSLYSFADVAHIADKLNKQVEIEQHA